MAKQQSKPRGATPAAIFIEAKGDYPTPLTLTADPKTFKSGKEGWWGQARWTIGESRYMVQLQVVEIKKATE